LILVCYLSLLCKEPSTHNSTGLGTPIPEFPPKTEQLGKLASQILDVIQRYGQHIAPKDGEEHHKEWIGKPMFMTKVLHQLEKSEPVKMILPAFPWKSVSYLVSMNLLGVHVLT